MSTWDISCGFSVCPPDLYASSIFLARNSRTVHHTQTKLIQYENLGSEVCHGLLNFPCDPNFLLWFYTWKRQKITRRHSVRNSTYGFDGKLSIPISYLSSMHGECNQLLSICTANIFVKKKWLLKMFRRHIPGKLTHKRSSQIPYIVFSMFMGSARKVRDEESCWF